MQEEGRAKAAGQAGRDVDTPTASTRPMGSSKLGCAYICTPLNWIWADPGADGLRRQVSPVEDTCCHRNSAKSSLLTFLAAEETHPLVLRDLRASPQHPPLLGEQSPLSSHLLLKYKTASSNLSPVRCSQLAPRR